MCYMELLNLDCDIVASKIYFHLNLFKKTKLFLSIFVAVILKIECNWN